MKQDLTAGFVLLALAALYWWLSRDIAVSALSDGVGPDGLPKLLAAALAILSLALIGKGLAARRAPREADIAPEEEESRLSRALGFLALGVGYVLIAPLAGFALGIALLVFATAWFEGARPDWRLAAISLAIGAGFWLVFVRILGVEQPVSRFLG